ncbi:hypothetical protein PENSPDRAFT_503110 [Peniophora sp. CONT]|nr:hypothetical protein PENSPDRAFT_503110 [Peniophora sp. CONT]
MYPLYTLTPLVYVASPLRPLRTHASANSSFTPTCTDIVPMLLYSLYYGSGRARYRLFMRSLASDIHNLLATPRTLSVHLNKSSRLPIFVRAARCRRYFLFEPAALRSRRRAARANVPVAPFVVLPVLSFPVMHHVHTCVRPCAMPAATRKSRALPCSTILSKPCQARASIRLLSHHRRPVCLRGALRRAMHVVHVFA